MNDTYFMKIAIEESKLGDYPYGAVVVKENQIIAQGHNTGGQDKDSTAHAEVNVIRMAEKKLGKGNLSGCTLYTSSESCPMCTGAEIWAGISRVVYGASIAQLMEAGQKQINTPAAAIIRTGFAPVELVGGVLEAEAIEVVKVWAQARKGH